MKSPVPRRFLAILALAGCLAVFAATPADAQRRKKPSLEWSSNVLLAMEEAKLRNVPIVLHIHGDT